MAKLTRRGGYLHWTPMPSKAELEKYYKDKYYQNEHPMYKKHYTPLEKSFINHYGELAETTYRQLRQGNAPATVIDIGCGEGYLLNHFKSIGSDVIGMDYSDEGIRTHNPHLLKHFVRCDLDKIDESLGPFSFISLKNVLEHVPRPKQTLAKMRALMNKDTILRIQVPNDDSPLHRELETDHYLQYPEHLNHFNHETFRSFLESQGLRIVAFYSDFPIEQQIFSHDYRGNRTLGHEAHYIRMRTTKHLMQQSREGFIRMCTEQAKLGWGRSLIAYCQKK